MKSYKVFQSKMSWLTLRQVLRYAQDSECIELLRVLRNNKDNALVCLHSFL